MGEMEKKKSTQSCRVHVIRESQLGFSLSVLRARFIPLNYFYRELIRQLGRANGRQPCIGIPNDKMDG